MFALWVSFLLRMSDLCITVQEKNEWWKLCVFLKSFDVLLFFCFFASHASKSPFPTTIGCCPVDKKKYESPSKRFYSQVCFLLAMRESEKKQIKNIKKSTQQNNQTSPFNQKPSQGSLAAEWMYALHTMDHNAQQLITDAFNSFLGGGQRRVKFANPPPSPLQWWTRVFGWRGSELFCKRHTRELVVLACHIAWGTWVYFFYICFLFTHFFFVLHLFLTRWDGSSLAPKSLRKSRIPHNQRQDTPVMPMWKQPKLFC